MPQTEIMQLQTLKKVIEENNEAKIKSNLQQISKEIELCDVKLVHDLLRFNNAEIMKLTTELIAELAKLEPNRKILTDKEVIKNLLNLLENQNPDIVLNSVRALGNICYENEDATKIIDQFGTNSLLSILKEDSARSDNILTTKTTGLLLNLFNLNEGLIRTSLRNGIVPILDKILQKYLNDYNKNEQILVYLVSIINNLEQYFEEQKISFTQNLCKSLVDVFKQSSNPEILVPCLEIFHGQCEQEDIKTFLAKEGICEQMFHLIEQYKNLALDEDSRSVLKMACDFMVVILTGDDCMILLYANGEGAMYKNMITWLDSEDIDILSSGVLAIGNFARKEEHCIQMVQTGISKKLLEILKKYNLSTNSKNVKIQHALLSTLKNLVIPKKNKEAMLNEGLIEVIYPMIQNENYLVVFKLLGTLRMAIEGQESSAIDLITRKEFLERLMHWSQDSDHLGIRGEVPRLLAWLIKQCDVYIPYKLLLQTSGIIKCLVEMISSSHAVMQNEAFFAITTLYKGCKEISKHDTGDSNLITTLINELIEAKIGKNLNFILTKYADKMDATTIENLVNCLEQLVSSKEICTHLKETDLFVPFQKIHSNPNICKTEIIHRIEEQMKNKE